MKTPEQKLVRFDFYLRLSRSGKVEAMKKPPALAPNERAVRLNLSVPASVFATPQLTAKIAFEGEPTVIDAIEITSRVQDILDSNGLNVAVVFEREQPADD